MASERRTIRMELNRVEGDMEVRLELAGHDVTDAWCVGTMFRGFEQILAGRDPGDALVIAPRICGICSTSQLYAAASALETAYGLPIAANGTRIRNLCLMAESVMSDARHTFLMFTPDFCNPAYAGHPLSGTVHELFEPPFKGRLARETVEHTKRILATVIAFGGQWPHSTYMMPGGVTCALDEDKLAECDVAIDGYEAWYEREVLGCTSEEWLALKTAEDFDGWMEAPAHHDRALGVFARFGRSIGLAEQARGTPHLLSTGSYYDPERWQPPFEERPCLAPGGFYDGERGTIEPFSHLSVAQHMRYSRLEDPGAPRHPWESETVPDESRDEAYSYAKATRYKDRVVQLGPLADLVPAATRSRARCSPLREPARGCGSSRAYIVPSPPCRSCARRSASCARTSTNPRTSTPSRRPKATASARSTPPGAASSTGSGSGTARSPTTRSSRPPPGTARRATAAAGAGTGRRASSGSR
jgi:uptake hydrogenase large subunit